MKSANQNLSVKSSSAERAKLSFGILDFGVTELIFTIPARFPKPQRKIISAVGGVLTSFVHGVKYEKFTYPSALESNQDDLKVFADFAREIDLEFSHSHVKFLDTSVEHNVQATSFKCSSFEHFLSHLEILHEDYSGDPEHILRSSDGSFLAISLKAAKRFINQTVHLDILLKNSVLYPSLPSSDLNKETLPRLSVMIEQDGTFSPLLFDSETHSVKLSSSTFSLWWNETESSILEENNTNNDLWNKLMIYKAIGEVVYSTSKIEPWNLK